MNSSKKFIVSHAPFWHNGSGVPERNYNAIIALIPAALMGLAYFGVSALGVIGLSVATAVGWELAFTKIAKRPNTVGDGHAALIGLIFGLLLPAAVPWWFVLTGTFIAVVIGKQIFGGIGSYPFNPAVLSAAILSIAWKSYFDFDAQLVNYNFSFFAPEPLSALKAFGPEAVRNYSLSALFLGQQTGGLGATCGLAIVIGGIYLIIRGFVRWEIPLAYIVGIVFTSLVFNIIAPDRFVGPGFHLLTGYTLLGAFFLATDDSSSPVNVYPMLIFGVLGGFMTILIRNIGAYPDGTLYAILLMNLINPLVDKIRPQAIGKVA